MCGTATLGAAAVPEHLPGGAQQPRQRLGRERLEAAPGDQEGLRHDFLGHLAALGPSQDVGEDARVAGAKDRFEASGRQRLLQDRSVVGHYRCSARRAVDISPGDKATGSRVEDDGPLAGSRWGDPPGKPPLVDPQAIRTDQLKLGRAIP